MQFMEHVTQEVANLRAKAAAVKAEAEKEVADLESQAVALESKLANAPAELLALADEAAHNVWSWIKAL